MDAENKKAHWIFLGLLFLAGIALYSNSLKVPFLFDDGPNIIQNASLRKLPDLRAIWDANAKTRFLPYLSFAVNCSVGKANVFGYHLFNLALHIFNSFWVYLLVLGLLATPKLRGTYPPNAAIYLAGFSALLFLCHPLQTQAVTYLVQRITSMAAFFYLGAVVLYLKARLEQNRSYYCIAWGMTVAAMFCKEISFTLPAVLILTEALFFGFPEGKRKAFLRWVPFLATLFIIPFFVHAEVKSDMVRHVFLPIQKNALSRGDYFLTEINVLGTYLRLFFFPAGQNADYAYPLAHSFFEPKTFSCFLILAGLFASALAMWRRNRLAAFSIFWFFLTLSVESSFFPIDDVIAEHRMYLPLAGCAIFLSVGIYFLLRKISCCVAAGVILLAVLSGMTCARNRVWRNEVVFWEDVIRKSPQKARGYNNLGQYYCTIGERGKGLELFETAYRLDPHYVPACFNLALGYHREGKLDRALALYEKTIEMDPEYYIAYNNRGNVYAQQGNWDAAAGAFKKAIAIEPSYVPAYDNLGLVYQRKGDRPTAVAFFNKAIQLDPDYASAYTHLGMVLNDRGEKVQAVKLFRKAMQLDPRDKKPVDELYKLYLHRTDAAPEV